MRSIVVVLAALTAACSVPPGPSAADRRASLPRAATLVDALGRLETDARVVAVTDALGPASETRETRGGGMVQAWEDLGVHLELTPLTKDDPRRYVASITLFERYPGEFYISQPKGTRKQIAKRLRVEWDYHAELRYKKRGYFAARRGEVRAAIYLGATRRVVYTYGAYGLREEFHAALEERRAKARNAREARRFAERNKTPARPSGPAPNGDADGRTRASLDELSKLFDEHAVQRPPKVDPERARQITAAAREQRRKQLEANVTAAHAAYVKDRSNRLHDLMQAILALEYEFPPEGGDTYWSPFYNQRHPIGPHVTTISAYPPGRSAGNSVVLTVATPVNAGSVCVQREVHSKWTYSGRYASSPPPTVELGRAVCKPSRLNSRDIYVARFTIDTQQFYRSSHRHDTAHLQAWTNWRVTASNSTPAIVLFSLPYVKGMRY